MNSIKIKEVRKLVVCKAQFAKRKDENIDRNIKKCNVFVPKKQQRDLEREGYKRHTFKILLFLVAGFDF